MQCEKCGGDMWDNRNNKRNPRSPDFKCKNKECGHGVWSTPKPTNRNGPNPPPGTTPTYTPPPSWKALALTYQRCYAIAGKVVGNDNPDRHAATATLFIAAQKSGLIVEAPKPPPPPRPPAPVDDYTEEGEYVDDGASY